MSGFKMHENVQEFKTKCMCLKIIRGTQIWVSGLEKSIEMYIKSVNPGDLTLFL